MLNAHLKKNASKQKTRLRSISLYSLGLVAIVVIATSFSSLGQIFDVTVAKAQTIGGLRIKTAPQGSVKLWAGGGKLYVLNSFTTLGLPSLYMTSFPITQDGGLSGGGVSRTLSTKVTDGRYGPGEYWETNWKAEDLTYGTSPSGKTYLFALASDGLGSPSAINAIPSLTRGMTTRDFRAVFAYDVSNDTLAGTFMSWVDEFCNANDIEGGYLAGGAQYIYAVNRTTGAPTCRLDTSNLANMVNYATIFPMNSYMSVDTRSYVDYGGYRYILSNGMILIHQMLNVMEGTTANKAILSWLTTGGITSYKLYRSLNSFSSVTESGVSPIATKSFNDTPTYTDNGLSASKTYHYRLAYMAGNSLTMLSNEVVVPPQPDVLATPVISVTQGSSADKATVSWSAISAATGYRLYRSTSAFSAITDGGVTAVADITGGNVITYTNAGLVGGTTYHYRLSAMNTTMSSSLSNEASIVVPLTPPVLSAKADSSSQITLSWGDVPTAERYKLQISSSFATARTISAGSNTSFVATGLLPATEYSFSAQSSNSSSVSEWSVPVTATTLSGLKIGLKVFNGTQAFDLEATAQLSPVSSSLRVSKGGTVYSMIMVPIGDTNASKVRVKTAGGIMAIKKP